MDAKEYQEQAARTLISNPGEFTHQEMMTIWTALGLAGEAGEVAEKVKKGIFHRHGLEREKLIKELGDVCWYLASICTVQNIDLGEVMQANIEKLRLRYPDGFSTTDSVKRVDVVFPSMELCQCGHVKRDHANNIAWCFHEDETQNNDCECTQYTPILPALLRADQPPLFDTDK